MERGGAGRGGCLRGRENDKGGWKTGHDGRNDGLRNPDRGGWLVSVLVGGGTGKVGWNG